MFSKAAFLMITILDIQGVKIRYLTVTQNTMIITDFKLNVKSECSTKTHLGIS